MVVPQASADCGQTLQPLFMPLIKRARLQYCIAVSLNFQLHVLTYVGRCTCPAVLSTLHRKVQIGVWRP